MNRPVFKLGSLPKVEVGSAPPAASPGKAETGKAAPE